MNGRSRLILIAIALAIGGGIAALAAAPGNPKPVKQSGGIWTDRQGAPTYKISKDGTVDWGTFVGYLRYSDTCLRCHGPDGLGSSYAPDLVHALKGIDYSQFIADVAGGIKAVNSAQDLVMPSFGTDRNVMCFIQEIYVYLRARSTGALGRGRPEKRVASPKGFNQSSYKCLGISM
ncbi:MAG: c-type cytochrome, methanol metabolism-related [Rhodospirillales bacterium]|nr:c-type cytochrome, methanol metabolism-related [Rhodospirillales bacterium]